jgi:hypothetical protein
MGLLPGSPDPQLAGHHPFISRLMAPKLHRELIIGWRGCGAQGRTMCFWSHPYALHRCTEVHNLHVLAHLVPAMQTA